MSLLDRRKKQRRKQAASERPDTTYVVPVARIEVENGKRKLVFDIPLVTQTRRIRDAILNRFKRKKVP